MEGREQTVDRGGNSGGGRSDGPRRPARQQHLPAAAVGCGERLELARRGRIVAALPEAAVARVGQRAGVLGGEDERVCAAVVRPQGKGTVS